MAEEGTDLSKTVLCEICNDDKKRVAASYFCQQCEQYLCIDCKHYHEKVKATTSHEVVRLEDLPRISSLILDSEDCGAPLCRDHGRKVKYFCETHMVELCLTCRRMEHKTCKFVEDIGKALNEVYTAEHGEGILRSIKELLDKFICYKTTAESFRSTLSKKKQNAIDSVKETRKSIELYLDKLEADAVAEIERIFSEEGKCFSEQIHVCDASISVLQKRVSKIDKIMTWEGNRSILEFLEINNVTKETKRYSSILYDITKEIAERDIKFEHNSNISKFKKLLQCLGTVSVANASDNRIFGEATAIYTGEIKLKTDMDSNDPLVSSFSELPNGRKLLVDYKNKKLKLFDGQNIFLTETAVPIVPSSLVLLGATDAIISTFSNKLLYLNISDELRLTETKKTRSTIGPMVKYGENILALLFDDDKSKLAVIDKHINIKKTIVQDSGNLFKRPYFLALSKDLNTVYVLDGDNGCIGLTMEGQVAYKYQDPAVKNYCGLAVNDDGLFVGCDRGNGFQVQLLSRKCEPLKTPDFGNSFPLKAMDNELVLYTANSKSGGTISFYSMLK